MSNYMMSGWQKAATIATFIQLFVVGISLWFIGSQLKQQRMLSRAANSQAIVGLATPLNLKVLDRSLSELWVKGDEGIEKVTDPQEQRVEKEQYETIIANYMTFYENVYSQHAEGLLDDKIYEGWDKDLANFIDETKMEKRWNKWKNSYRKDFSDHVDQIIAAKKSP